MCNSDIDKAEDSGNGNGVEVRCGPLSRPVQISSAFRVEAQNPNSGPPPQGDTEFAPGKFHPHYSF